MSNIPENAPPGSTSTVHSATLEIPYTNFMYHECTVVMKLDSRILAIPSHTTS